MKLRRVEVADWKEGTKTEALFHQFGLDFIEMADGNVNYTVAIVEWPNGTVSPVNLEHLKFLDPPEVSA